MQERQVNGYTVMVKNVPLADRNADALARVFNYVQPNKVWCASLISTTVNTKVAFFFWHCYQMAQVVGNALREKLVPNVCTQVLLSCRYCALWLQ